MSQLRQVLAGPHGGATIVTFSLAGVALVLGLLHLVQPRPTHRRWSRLEASIFPLAVAWTLAIGAVVVQLRAGAFEVAMFLRMLGFWAMVLTAPFAVGQVVELRPPTWLQRTHLGLAAGFLLLLATTELVFADTEAYAPMRQFGPLAVAFLVPVAAFAGWWLLSCLGRIQTRSGLALFALGGSTTVLALVIASLVVDPVLADHFLVVGFLPVLAASELVGLQRWWSDRGLRRVANA